jgi:hypothetical protein
MTARLAVPQGRGGGVSLLKEGPAAGGEEIFPPRFVFAEALLFVGGEWRAGRRDGRERSEAGGGAEGVDLIGRFDGPRAGEAVARVVKGLGAVALRAAFEEGDAIGEIGGLPTRDVVIGGFFCEEVQGAALEGRIADGVLDDEPGGVGAVGADFVLVGPAVLVEDLAEAGGVFFVDLLHGGDVGMADEGAGVGEFGAQGFVGVLHGEEFGTESFVDHLRI